MLEQPLEPVEYDFEFREVKRLIRAGCLRQRFAVGPARPVVEVAPATGVDDEFALLVASAEADAHRVVAAHGFAARSQFVHRGLPVRPRQRTDRQAARSPLGRPPLNGPRSGVKVKGSLHADSVPAAARLCAVSRTLRG